MGQLVARLNTALTSGSWTDEYGNVWTVRNTLKAAEDPDGGNNAIQFSRNAAQISTTTPSNMKDEWTLTCWVKEPINCLFSSSGNTNMGAQFWDTYNGNGGSTYLDSKTISFYDKLLPGDHCLKLYEMQENEYNYKNGWFFFEICRDKYNWVTLYINQKYKYRVKASEKAYFAQNSSLILGNWVNDGWHYHGGWFNGYLYDIKLYNYALYPGPASIINTKINMY